MAHVLARVKAGNRYVNRNIIGAVVGVQPFGGRGLSGTGPKAGGPLYIRRLVQTAPEHGRAPSPSDPALGHLIGWLEAQGLQSDAAAARRCADRSELGLERTFQGPVGERNLYALRPRGRILAVPLTASGLYRQLAAILATGNEAVIDASVDSLRTVMSTIPALLASRISWSTDWEADGPYSGALIEGDTERVRAANLRISQMSGPLIPVQAASTSDLLADPDTYGLNWLLEEVSTSINTTASGGNASLMAIS
jgi:RHH-type proline utilization regulon transcriptional repressor/proline dehydrogenase/delta 1-pyrroline-5-carboxylate dehydrogenase